jgi:hypothetical protein
MLIPTAEGTSTWQVASPLEFVFPVHAGPVPS